MSKKTTKKAAAPKATKSAKKSVPVEQQPKDECPRGGNHEPDAEGDCKKCLEPGGREEESGEEGQGREGTQACEGEEGQRPRRRGTGVGQLEGTAQRQADGPSS